MLICAICGRSDVKISSVKGICKDCFIKQGLISNIKPLKLTICPRCFRIRKDRWMRMNRFEDIELFIEKEFEKKIVTKEGVILESLNISLDPSLLFAKAEADLFLQYYDEYVSLDLDLEIDLKKNLCDNCLRLKTENYEALIQIRSFDNNLLDEFESLLDDLSEEESESLIKKERYNYGLDIYFSSLAQARKLVREFRKKRICRYKETRSIVSGPKYRYTILLDFK